METPKKTIALELISIDEMEGRSVENWRVVIEKWDPVTKAFAKILASVGADQRINIAQGLSEIGTDSDEPDHVFYYTHLASLSDEAIKKIKGALD